MHSTQYLFGLYFLFSWMCSFGQSHYLVDTQYPVHDLNPVLEIVPDSAGTLTIVQLLTDSLAFQPLHEVDQPLRIGWIYWARVQLSASDSLRDWRLILQNRYFNGATWLRGNGKVDVYGVQRGRILFHERTGADYPRSVKTIQERWTLNQVPLPLPAKEQVWVYLRIQGNSAGMPPYIQATIRKAGFYSYYPAYPFHASFNLFLLGITFIVFVYHFLQYLYLRQAIFLWFSIWVFVCFLTLSIYVGLETVLIFDLPSIRFPLWVFVSNGILFSFWFFGRSYTNSAEKFPQLDKYMLALSLVIAAEVVYTVIATLAGWYQPNFATVGYHFYFVILFSILGLVLAIILTVQPDQFARYFGIGAIFATLAPLIGGLWTVGVISLNFDPYNWGIFLQAIAYSFGIAYRQRQLSLQAQQEQLAAQRSLSEIQRIKDLDEVKTRFFANISHEFRTPLSLILGIVQQVRRNGKLSSSLAEATKQLEGIETNAQRLQKLVDQLLELSKLESGHSRLNVQQGDLVSFLRKLVVAFEPLADRRQISLNLTFPDEQEQAWYDSDKLDKIVGNLLSNAFKYTPRGGAVSVHLGFDQRYLHLAISDTGKGIDPQEVTRIFDRFYRVEGTEEKGSGIGLALTKELVDIYRGQISVDSTKGRGTTFKVRLPYTALDLQEIGKFEVSTPTSITVPAEATVSSKLISAPPATNTKSSNSPLVLVVEDHPELRDFIVGILSEDYRVVEAENGTSGLKQAFEHIPDVIISDVMMPGMDGFELCAQLKTNLKTSHIPLILLTAKAGQDNKMTGLSRGADAYLTKPFDAEELLLRVRNLMAIRQNLWKRFQGSDLVLVEGLDMRSVEDQFLQQVVSVIRENLSNETLSVEDIAREVGFSRAQLHRKLKALTNKSANQLVVEIRLNEARNRLEQKQGSVSEIAYAVGYSNLSYFTKSFKQKFGELPSKISG